VVGYLNKIGAVTRVVQGIPLLYRKREEYGNEGNEGDHFTSFGQDQDDQYPTLKTYIDGEDKPKFDAADLLMLSVDRVKLQPMKFERKNIIGVVCQNKQETKATMNYSKVTCLTTYNSLRQELSLSSTSTIKVMCPKNCDKESGKVYGYQSLKIYTRNSPLCKSAIHGKLIDAKQSYKL